MGELYQLFCVGSSEIIDIQTFRSKPEPIQCVCILEKLIQQNCIRVIRKLPPQSYLAKFVVLFMVCHDKNNAGIQYMFMLSAPGAIIFGGPLTVANIQSVVYTAGVMKAGSHSKGICVLF